MKKIESTDQKFGHPKLDLEPDRTTGPWNYPSSTPMPPRSGGNQILHWKKRVKGKRKRSYEGHYTHHQHKYNSSRGWIGDRPRAPDNTTQFIIYNQTFVQGGENPIPLEEANEEAQMRDVIAHVDPSASMRWLMKGEDLECVIYSGEEREDNTLRAVRSDLGIMNKGEGDFGQGIQEAKLLNTLMREISQKESGLLCSDTNKDHKYDYNLHPPD